MPILFRESNDYGEAAKQFPLTRLEEISEP